MARVKLTIQELKRQRDGLKRYRRFLPTLTLKKLQLQIQLNKRRSLFEEKLKEEEGRLEAFRTWIAVMGEEAGITGIIGIEAIEEDTTNVAGVEIPLLKGVRFKRIEYDLFTTPLWVDRAVEELKRLLSLRVEILTIQEQLRLLEEELQTTIQRVNLFEKIKIPEALENIRSIQVFLGDQQTAAVVRGKISKKKISLRAEASHGWMGRE
jgi:V/A-type H+-transporting ATPase subunit D